MDELKKSLNRIKWDNIVTALVAIIIGILFIVLPGGSVYTLCKIAGILLVVSGAVAIIVFFVHGFAFGGSSLVLGIALIFGGIFCISHPMVVASVLTVIFGAYIVVDSASLLADSILCARMKTKGWIPMLIISICTVILGVSVMFGNFEAIMVFAGVALIIDGGVDIIQAILFSRRIKEAKTKLHEKDNVVYYE